MSFVLVDLPALPHSLAHVLVPFQPGRPRSTHDIERQRTKSNYNTDMKATCSPHTAAMFWRRIIVHGNSWLSEVRHGWHVGSRWRCGGRRGSDNTPVSSSPTRRPRWRVRRSTGPGNRGGDNRSSLMRSSLACFAATTDCVLGQARTDEIAHW